MRCRLPALGPSLANPQRWGALPALSCLRHRTFSPLSAPSARPTGQSRKSSYSIPTAATPTHPSAPARKKITVRSLQDMFARGEPISMVTAYDFPTGLAAEAAGVDMILVGDSSAMVALGMPDTTEMELDEMVIHSRAVSRAVQHAFLVADLPFGSFETSSDLAVRASLQLVKKGRAHAVKIEGGKHVGPTITRIVRDAGIPVLAHIGLTPQRVHSFGGFRAQARTADDAARLLEDALAVQEAGAFAVVIEAVAAPVASIVSSRLSIPTIGIGAGAGCAGQVLVQSDICGMLPNANWGINARAAHEIAHAGPSAAAAAAAPPSTPTPLPLPTTPGPAPKFVRQYGNVYAEAVAAMSQYKDDVKRRAFPAREHEYGIPAKELAEFMDRLGIRQQADCPPRAATAGQR